MSFRGYRISGSLLADLFYVYIGIVVRDKLCARSRRPLEKEQNLFSLYYVLPLESVIPIQVKIQVLWTSSPHQLKRKFLKANKTYPLAGTTVTGHLTESSSFWKR